MLDLPVKMIETKARVRLLKPHAARLNKAAEVLEPFAVLPCDQQQECAQVAAWLREFATQMARRDGKFLPGQKALPFRRAIRSRRTPRQSRRNPKRRSKRYS